MKVLNRPMFRMGGPIKEGIMDGIKEPRRKYNAAGFVAPNFQIPGDPNAMAVNKLLQNQENAAAAFQNIFAPNVMASEVSLVPKKVTAPAKSIFSTTEDAFGDISGLSSDFDTTERVGGKIVMKPAKDYVGYEPGIDTTTKEFIKGLGEPGVSEGYLKAKAKFEKRDDPVVTGTTIQDVNRDDRKIKPDVSLKTDPPVVTETKKERVNKILDSLGYKRAQKNALYDAMIKAGQRISRTGLGADNLVSDVIAETSQSYDKPEKLREAAELMDVQQQLKLEQIEKSKDTRSPIQKTAEYYLESGVAENMDDAIRMARNLPVTVSETFQTKVKEFGKSGGLDQTAIDLTERGQFGDLEFKNKINKKYKGKPLSEFLKSPGFKGDGVYTADGKILVIENGEIKQTIVVRGSIEDSIFNFGNEN